jgi:F420-dependent oxidoreductase-like protein
MRFSVWPSPASPWDEILGVAGHCEATGWDGIYFADHFMPDGPGTTPLDGDTLECWSVIAGLAAAVPRIRLAPLVTSVTYRHPAVLAKMASAIDRISGGRLTLGVGAGWQENEHASYGIELGSVKQRLDRFEEAVAILVSMLREPRTTFAGDFFQLTDAPNQPAPVQERLPLLVGGRGERRTMRIAARYADEWNSWTSPDELTHKVKILEAHCDDFGRDPAEVHVSTQALLFLSTDELWLSNKRQRDPKRPVIAGTPGEVAEIVNHYRRAGADELIIPDFTLGPINRRKDTLDLFMEEVVPQVG